MIPGGLHHLMLRQQMRAVNFWRLSDGDPYNDTGLTGGEDMSQVGTVTDDGEFGGISLSGAGAVGAPDTSSVWDNLFSGADKKFSLKAVFEFDNFTADQLLFARFQSIPTAGRSFITMIRSGGQNIDLGWYGANDGSAYRVIRVSLGAALSAATEYKIAFSYDGSIDTNDGLDRGTLFINGTEYAFTSTVASLNTLANNDIATTDAYLAIGGYVRSDGTLQSGSNLNGNVKNAGVYDYIIDAIEAGA